METTKRSPGAMVVELLNVFAWLALGTGAIAALAWWISPILGSITSMFLIFVWTFGVAPILAGRMVAALIIYFRERKRARG